VTRPDGMTAKVWERIGKLPADVRDRVLERAAVLIFQAGVAPAEADARALAEEAGVATQYSLIGGAQ
jgi:hypothetical protein